MAELSREFTDACNAEQGCLFFQWARSLADPNEYVLIEAFADDAAGGAHVQSAHFIKATQQLPQYLSRTPDIINTTVDGWSVLGEMAVE